MSTNLFDQFFFNFVVEDEGVACVMRIFDLIAFLFKKN